ncbi:nuclear transport factor 2 family protein [Carboxylicivirga caseinilyticus]|uniref:nuclear transport factor 2 family protein n=1 Tax=Carboxylicivirga caseinilyticus TaxID=3417572 RepID=UPI003D33C245|nr:nuclear transport factor 2 family protein [Marinilabiliaceae bacterium A049]
MNLKLFVVMVGVAVLVSCAPNPPKSEVDTKVVEKEITALLDEFHSVFVELKIDRLSSMMDDDGLFIGSDPTEFWDKNKLIGLWEEAKQNTSDQFEYDIDKRVLKVSKDGLSCIVVEQFYIPYWSEEMPFRLTTNWIKSDMSWKINFMDWAFIPYNEDIATINTALKEEPVTD